MLLVNIKVSRDGLVSSLENLKSSAARSNIEELRTRFTVAGAAMFEGRIAVRSVGQEWFGGDPKEETCFAFLS